MGRLLTEVFPLDGPVRRSSASSTTSTAAAASLASLASAGCSTDSHGRRSSIQAAYSTVHSSIGPYLRPRASLFDPEALELLPYQQYVHRQPEDDDEDDDDDDDDDNDNDEDEDEAEDGNENQRDDDSDEEQDDSEDDSDDSHDCFGSSAHKYAFDFSSAATAECIYRCMHCQTDICHSSSVISTDFWGVHGKSYLVSSVLNVQTGKMDTRQMRTGNYGVKNIYCVQCGETLGWKYCVSESPREQYKIGKYVIERGILTEFAPRRQSRASV